MKKIILTLLFFLFFVKPVFATGDLSINEFSSASSTEWIELVNSNTTTAFDLTNYKLRVINGGTPVVKDLSGSVPKDGLLTFSYTSENIMPDAGATLQLLDASDTVVYSITYGSGADIPTAPTSSQSAYYAHLLGSWQIGTPTKGWCNGTLGGCPTVADIVTAMNADGVTTNLGTQEDMSRISGLYFEKEGKGRISFLNEMNFTDSDAMDWMQTLDSKINMSTVGTISLDADLIKNLMNTQATLTMYSLTLNDPEVLVNGAADTGGVVSGLSYNKSTGQLSFTAAHFTTFKAQDKATSSSSGGAAGPGAPSCNSTAPTNAPDLFQIRTTGKSAMIYFTPPIGNYDRFFIAYGTKPGVYPYGVEFTHDFYPYVIGYQINALKPGVKYYFTIRAGNNCMPGAWSNVMYARTNGATFHRVTQ